MVPKIMVASCCEAIHYLKYAGQNQVDILRVPAPFRILQVITERWEAEKPEENQKGYC